MLLSFVFLSLFLALTTALPHRSRSIIIPLHKRSSIVKDGVVDLGHAHANARHSERKFLRGRAAYERHTGARALSSSGFAQRDAGPETLTDDNNYRWYGTICVGSPPANLTVVLDTGSSDLLLPGANCGSTCTGHTLYNPNASSSAVYLNETFTMSFGDGSAAAGEEYADTVTVAGFTATNQTIAVASQYSTSFERSRFIPDGVLGMGFPSISVLHAPPFVQTLIAENQLSNPVFTFKLDNSESLMTLGSIDTSLYTGSVTYTPIHQSGFWEIQLDSINVNNQAATKNVSAVIDTGSTLIISNSQTAASFYSSLNATDIGNGFYAMPCNAMPNVSITIGGTPFAISPEAFNLGKSNLTDLCVGAVAGNGNLGNTWIIGDVFLRNVYSIFDVGNMQVGFAKPA